MAAHQGLSRLRVRGCSGHGWGFVAPDVQDPPQCINMCRERFLRELLPKDETFERVCEALEDKGHMDREQPFRALYCCDSQLCGVDNLGEGGKDHPGPPKADYICDSESIIGGDPRCQKAQSSNEDENEAPESASSTSTPSSKDATSATSTASETSTTITAQRSMTHTTYSTSSDPSLVASLDPSSRDEDSKDDAGLPLAVKVTIAVIVVVGLAAIAVLVYFLLRRRKRSRRSDLRRQIKHPTSPPPADSPTPLVSPTLSHPDGDGVPLTPPARLRERRFLPTLAEQSLSNSGRRRDQSGFPMSPLCSPTSSNLTPRHEETLRVSSAGHTPAVPMIVMTAPDGGPGKQNKRAASFSSSAVTPPASAQMMPPGYSGGSPPRPPRPRDGPFRILASPGPPPNRALPSTPINRPSTPTKPYSGPEFKGTTISSPTNKPAQGLVLSPEAQELRDMTESYAREGGRSSGGSFTGVMSLSPTKPRNASSPIMEERDLERLGGSY
ncbi:hypothetical protein FALBO_5021 [Fusarium albosuccineum]|uniref:Uncharacterized protein n=1 Tax=Fusarium albosuccineum TaxID=1237068 RepID=A0A8H4PFU7_9HYPO|nr:hypothetical protein FALBO_5021 [Fusarium albosuccineum]